MIESGRYAKPRSLPRSERICKLYKFNCIENEFHFISQCPFYEPERCSLWPMLMDNDQMKKLS